MHKELHILGLLLSGPKTGYQLHGIVVAHGELFTDLKKGNVYYLLERLAASGMLVVAAEGGARGPRRERLVYSITEQGRARFLTLLHEVLRSYEVAHSGVEVGMIFLPYLTLSDAIRLLEERREAVLARRDAVERDAGGADHLHEHLAQDHLLCMMEAELTWIARTVERLRQRAGEDGASPTRLPSGCSGLRTNDPA